MMIATANATGRATRPAISRVGARSRAAPTSFRPAVAAITASRITIGPSTRKPKSMAPSDMRSPVTPKRCMPSKRDRHRRRDAEHDRERAAHGPEEQREHERDDQHALGQVRHARS